MQAGCSRSVATPARKVDWGTEGANKKLRDVMVAEALGCRAGMAGGCL